MIDGVREFALRWLLEPTKKVEESQYEYVFKLITYSVDKQTVVTYDTSQPDKGYIDTTTIETASTIPIIQANLYKKTSQGRNFIGTIEYFKMLRVPVQDFTTEETYFYVYILSATASALQLSSFEKQTDYSYNPDPYGIGLPGAKTAIHERPSKIFTAEFFQFAESLNYRLNSSGAISISGISYPDYEYYTTIIQEGVYGDLTTTDVFTATGKNISFSYEACKSTLKNLDDYQGYLNTRLDREVSVPYQSTFARCSNGLTFDKFMAIAQETQYFSKNTTITFEHN